MSENFNNPIDHGPIGSASITARETVKGGIGGVFGGAARGGFWGALLTGGTTALGISAVGAAIVGAWGLVGSVVGLGSAVGAIVAAAPVIGGVALIGGLLTGAVGLAGGTILGAPVGALAGTVTGFSRGREIVHHDRGAARVLDTVRQQNEALTQTATAQMATANALRAEVIRRASAAPAAQPIIIATPGPHVVQAASHQGVGMRQAQAAEAAAGPKTHVQRVAEASAVPAQQQL